MPFVSICVNGYGLWTNATYCSRVCVMGREKRGGYIVEWWMGDHKPKHVHIYKDGDMVAKVAVPGMSILSGRVNSRIRKLLLELIREGRI